MSPTVLNSLWVTLHISFTIISQQTECEWHFIFSFSRESHHISRRRWVILHFFFCQAASSCLILWPTVSESHCIFLLLRQSNHASFVTNSQWVTLHFFFCPPTLIQWLIDSKPAWLTCLLWFTSHPMLNSRSVAFHFCLWLGDNVDHTTSYEKKEVSNIAFVFNQTISFYGQQDVSYSLSCLGTHRFSSHNSQRVSEVTLYVKSKFILLPTEGQPIC